MEIWKDIKDYEGLYQVSNLGNVKRLIGYQSKKERILKQTNNGNDYLSVTLSKNGLIKRFYLHRLVCDSFLINIENKKEVNHIDGNKLNNNLKNLEWATRSENQNHRYKTLNHKGANYGKKGSLNWKSKKVAKINDSNEIIEVYFGVMEAMRQTKINEASIRSCIYGKQKTAGGFKWRYI